MKTTICRGCRNEFAQSGRGVGTTRRYCSRACHNRARYIRQRDDVEARRQQKMIERRAALPVRPCEQCGEPFKPQRKEAAAFCSQRCAKTAWSRANADRVHEHTQRRRAIQYGVKVETVNRITVFERDDWTCQICGDPAPKSLIGTRSLKKPTVDHIVPLACGGEHSYKNAQCACAHCNFAKGKRLAA